MREVVVVSLRGGTRARLAIIASHPIQYHLPWFLGLAARPELELKVFFTHLPDPDQQGVGFETSFTWDIPLLEGYEWECLPSAVRSPGISGFFSNRLHKPAELISAWRPHAVILTGWQNLALVQSLLACVKLGIPRLIRAESNAMKERSWPVRTVHRLLLPAFDSFLAIGRSNRDFYIQCGVDKDRIFACPYFVDNDWFSKSAEALGEKRGALRRDWGIGTDDTCFLFAGKLEAKKRCLDLLAAFRAATESFDRMHLLVVGEGKLKTEAQQIAQGCPDRVTFAGFLNQSQMARAYVASDCLVLPSDYGETWGLVVNEAMACGRPAIVSDRVGCGLDLVEREVTGLVFPFGDRAALASVLVRAASDSDLLERMGRAGKARVIAEFSPERAIAGTLAAVHAIVGRRRGVEPIVEARGQ